MRFLIILFIFIKLFAVSITYQGGAEEVDGSMALIEYKHTKILLDTGAHINKKENNLTFNPKEINAIFLTHAHLDHIGRLIELYKKGFRGKIFSTKATKELSRVMLNMQNKYLDTNKSFSINKVMNLFVTVQFYKKMKFKDIYFEFFPAKHIPGSSSILFFTNKKILFSGDLGNRIGIFQTLNVKAPKADIVFVETTYGDYVRKSIKKEFKDFSNTIILNINKKIIWIPVFALDRTQKMLYEIGKLFDKNLIPHNTKIYLISPTANKITNLYINNPFWIDNQKAIPIISETFFRSDDWLQNKLKPPVIILSTSGMISAAASLGLLPQFVSRKDVLLLFVGYQSPNSYGGQIQSGKKIIEVNETNFSVNLSYKTFHIFSAHADAKDIDDWLINNKSSKIFLVHGNLENLKKRKQDLMKKGFKVKITKKYHRYKF